LRQRRDRRASPWGALGLPDQATYGMMDTGTFSINCCRLSLSTVGIYAPLPFVDLHAVYHHDQRDILATQRIKCVVLGPIEIIRVAYGSKDCLA
jgi:hypothetical protein